MFMSTRHCLRVASEGNLFEFSQRCLFLSMDMISISAKDTFCTYARYGMWPKDVPFDISSLLHSSSKSRKEYTSVHFIGFKQNPRNVSALERPARGPTTD